MSRYCHSALTFANHLFGIDSQERLCFQTTRIQGELVKMK